METALPPLPPKSLICKFYAGIALPLRGLYANADTYRQVSSTISGEAPDWSELLLEVCYSNISRCYVS